MPKHTSTPMLRRLHRWWWHGEREGHRNRKMHFHIWCCVPALSLAPAACLYCATWGSFSTQHRTGVMRLEADMTVPFLVAPLPS